jgi:hypothetical protein
MFKRYLMQLFSEGGRKVSWEREWPLQRIPQKLMTRVLFEFFPSELSKNE